MVCDFENPDMELDPNDNDTDGDGKDKFIWVVSVQFWEMIFVNDAWYFKGESVPTGRPLRQNNVIGRFLAEPNSTRDFTSYAFLTMIETNNTDVGN